jgi:hypothetical protein
MINLADLDSLGPLARDERGAFVTSDAAILFELTDDAALPQFLAELRRLGVNSPRLHWPSDDDGPVFVRALGSQLPLFDFDGSTIHAYIEQAPKVWVAAGWRQPRAREIDVPAGQQLLLWPPCMGRAIVEFAVEPEPDNLEVDAPAQLLDVAGARHMTQTLRLARSHGTEFPELWVLREQPFEQLAALAREHDDGQLGCLEYALAESNGATVVVVRLRQTTQRAQVWLLPSVGFHSHLKLPNLLVPCGTGVQPALRRDVVRRLLAEDAERMIWLAPSAGGTFCSESVPVAAFRPLAEAVDYSIDKRCDLKGWQKSERFAMETFVEREAAPAPTELRRSLDLKPPAPKGLLRRAWDRCRDSLRRLKRPVKRRATPPKALERRDKVAEAVQRFFQKPEALAPPPKPPEPPEEKPRLRLLEERFLAIAGPADAPERWALWPELAATYQGAEQWPDAALCWLSALWEIDRNDLWTWGWLRAEEQAARWHKTETGLAHVLSSVRPSEADVRALAAFAAWTARQPVSSSETANQCTELRECLERHEELVPVRAAWLAWLALARSGGNDVLTLARARDRLLERLHRRGLSADQDLPSFLRSTDSGPPSRKKTIGAWLAQLPELVQPWIERLYARQRWMGPLKARPPEPDEPSDEGELVTARWLGKLPPYGRDMEPYFTKALSDLTLAWGQARLGVIRPASRLVERAREILNAGDGAHRFLLEAYLQRIHEASEFGATAARPLAELAVLDQLNAEQRYKVDWLRQQSRILEPLERVDPYRGDAQTACADSLRQTRALTALAAVTDRTELAEQIDQLLSRSVGGDPDVPAVPRALCAALDLAPRIGEAYASTLLRRVEPALRETHDSTEQARLLERGLFVAAHFGQAEYVQRFASRFGELLERRQLDDALSAFESLAEQSFRGLRKLGMGDAIQRLLRQMADRLLPGQGWANLRRPLGNALTPAGWRALLHVAAGWFAGGQEERASLVLAEAADLLHRPKPELPPREQAALACAYAAALGQAPLSVALQRFEELFARLDRVSVTHSTNSHYSLSVLAVVEAVVQAVAHDDFALGQRVRRWLDEDEYLVRRRIHRDLRALMTEAGIQ